MECRFVLAFVGGPQDGAFWGLDSSEFHDGMIYEILYEGKALYRSNGPVDIMDMITEVNYVGNIIPSHDNPYVVVISM